MSKELNPNYTYIYSEELHQQIAQHKATGWTYCADGTKYSPKEMAIIAGKDKAGQISLQVHLIKKMFEGEIVSRSDIKPAEIKKVDKEEQQLDQLEIF